MTRRRRPPLSPEAAAIVRSLGNGRMSRRSLLGGAGALGVGAALSACGTGGTGGSTAEAPKAAVDTSDQDKIVNWANWTLYLDFDEKTKTYPTLEQFEKQTGIRATYDEAIEDNDTYYGKVQGQLKNGQDIGKDIVVFTDWMAGRVIRQGYVQELDKANMQNAGNILPNLADVGFDKGRKYSLTWQSGYAGLVWNKEKVPGGLTSVKEMLERPELKGKVEVLSEMRDTMGLLLLDAKVDISKDVWGSAEFEAAINVLDEKLHNGFISRVRGNSYKEDLISGECWAAIAWSGDVTQLNFENGDKWGFAIPENGGTLWSDNMLVPIGSPHKKNAERLMDYYYDPKVAAEVAAYVNYICPVQGAQEAMRSIDPSLAEDKLIFPTEEDLANVFVFRSLDPAEETQFTSRFQTTLGL